MPLKDFARAWDSAPMAPPSGRTDFPPLPDGTYSVRLDRAEVKQNRRGEPMVSLGFRVVAGEYRDRWVWKHQTVSADETRLSFLKRDLAFLGVNIARGIEDLPGELETAIGVELTVDLKTKRGNDGQDRQNSWLNPPEGWEPPDGIEIPFALWLPACISAAWALAGTLA